MIVLGNRLEFVTSYLGILRAQAVAVPVNPTATAGELARMIADSGSRIVVADADSISEVRGAVATLDEAHQDRPPARLHRGRPAVSCSSTPAWSSWEPRSEPDERSYDHLRAERAHHIPPLQDPEKLAALLYTSGTSGRPRAAMLTHRALLANIDQVAAVEPPMIHGDDVVLGGPAAVPRLRAQRGARRRAAPPRQAGAGRAVRPAGHPRPDRGRGLQRRPGGPAGVRLLARHRGPARAARPGAADAVRVGAAVR